MLPISNKRGQKKKTTAILLPNKELIIEFANWALLEKGAPAWSLHLDSFNSPHFDNLNSHLRLHKIPLEIVQNSYGDLGNAFRGIRLLCKHIIVQKD